MTKELLMKQLFAQWNSDRKFTDESCRAIRGILDEVDDRLETACIITDIVNAEAEESFKAGFDTALALMGGVK